MQFKLPFLASWPLGSDATSLKKAFSLRSSLSCSSPSLSTACREQARKQHTGLQLFNQSFRFTSSLVPFRLLAGAQPLPPLSYSKFHHIADLQKKKHFWNLYSASAKDTILHRPSNAHKSNPAYENQLGVLLLLSLMLDTDFLSMTKRFFTVTSDQ